MQTSMNPSRQSRILLAFLLAIAVLLRIAGAWGKELWLDELHSALIASRPLSEWLLPGKLGGYTPLYFFVSLPFSRLGGDFTARIPSIIFGVLTVYAAWRYAETKTPGRLLFPALAALFVAINPPLIVFSSYHRMYALYTLCLASKLTECDSPRIMKRIFWACAAFLTFPNAAFYVATFFVIGLFEPARRRSSSIAIGVVIALGILYALPGLLALQAETAAKVVTRFSPINLHLFLRFPKFLLGGPFGPAESTLRPFAVPFAILGWITLAWGGLRAVRGDGICRDLVALTLLPPILEAILLLFNIQIYQDKSYLPSAYFISLLLAYLISEVILHAQSSSPGGARRILVAISLVLITTAMLRIDAAWINPAHPFSMNERRDHVQLPLLEAAALPISSVDVNEIRPLVLGTPTFILGKLRYTPTKMRAVYAIEENIAPIAVSGPYHDFILHAVREAGIRIVPEREIPASALWITTRSAIAAQIVAVSPAGFKLIAVDDSVETGS